MRFLYFVKGKGKIVQVVYFLVFCYICVISIGIFV